MCIIFWQAGSNEKSDPDPRQRQNSATVEAQNGEVEGRGRLQWERGGLNFNLF
jgi:hypothetical protein